jgi:acetolactate synthase I/II/III large subunit
MSTIDRISDELQRQGVEAVFTLMSEDTARLIVELDRRGVPIYSTRHDSTAVGMADGYSRASGKVGVAIIGRGPALTNSLNPLITAAKAGSGIVVLVGDTVLGIDDPARAQAARAERMGKYLDQRGILNAANVPNVTLTSAATVESELAACFARARQGVAVAVNLPIDVLESNGAGSQVAPSHEPAPQPVAPAEEDIRLVADLLGESWAARHPVILAGYGAELAGAREQLTELGDLTGALMATTLMANSFFRGDPFDIGVAGTMSTPLASELVAEADLVLAFGASLNPYTTYRGDLLRKARVVQFDCSPDAVGRYLPAEVSVVGDARLAAAALVAELERRGFRSTGYRMPEVAERLRSFRLEDTVPDSADDLGLDPRQVMIALDKILPEERTLVVDGGHHFEFSMAHIRVPDPRGFVFANEYFSVSCGLAAALGAAVARRDRLTVLAIGDGGLLMNLGDLDTAVRYRLPMVVVVCNDGGFGSEIHYLQVNGLPDATARYENPSLAAVAEGLGGRGITIDSLDELEQVRGALKGLAGPLVLDCKVSSNVRAHWVDYLFASPTAASSK